VRYVAIVAACFALAGQLEAQRPGPGSLPPGAKLYVAPMEWNLDRFVTEQIREQGLALNLVARPEDADFVMTCLYQTLGSHYMSPGHYIQVKIVAARGGKQVWSADANDYALFFGRLRPHGPARAAAAIVRKLSKRIVD